MQFRENRQRRQNLVFSVIVSVLAALSLASVLVLSGIVHIPFFDKFSASEDVVEADEVPCLPEGAAPVTAEGIHVTVLNATGRPGLAGSIASALESEGAVVDATGNYDGQYYGTVKLMAGKSQVVNAYSLARLFDESTVRYAPSDPPTITIILGERFTDLPSSDEVTRILQSTDPFQPVPKCHPLPDSDGEAPAQTDPATEPAETAEETAGE